MASKRSLRALDCVAFFVADVQTGFGPFIAVFLTANKWTQGQIGVALSVGTITALVGQVPAGALVDTVHNKRFAAMAGVAAVSVSALLLAWFPIQLPVYIAEVLHGFASCVLTPAIVAVSLGLVGHAALGERLGRNARFSAIGNGLAAGVMGLIGSYVAPVGVFWLTAALGVPALVALLMIGRVGSVERGTTTDPFDWGGVRDMLTDQRLLRFAVCILLFHLSNAAMLPLAAAAITKSVGNLASVIVAACIVVPQVVVALMSPWVGTRAAVVGRRPVLVLGWSMLALRGVVMAVFPDPWVVTAAQALSGVSGAVFGVLFPLISADLTMKNRRLNLCMGMLGLAVYVGASFSTAMGGWIADMSGDRAAFLALALVGAAGTLACRYVMTETRPAPAAVTSAPVKAPPSGSLPT
jgi:MFS family permease